MLLNKILADFLHRKDQVEIERDCQVNRNDIIIYYRQILVFFVDKFSCLILRI